MNKLETLIILLVNVLIRIHDYIVTVNKLFWLQILTNL